MDEPRADARAGFPDQARVVIIGGGAIGTSIAYHLAKLGWSDVVLLERRQLTAGTTWHAAGLITSAGMATETLLWMARYTRDLCASLEAETGQATGFRPIGHLHLATTPQRLETPAPRGRVRARVRRRPTRSSRAPSSAASGRRRRPTTSSAAFYVPDEGRVNPADLTMAYATGRPHARRADRRGRHRHRRSPGRAAGSPGVDTDQGHDPRRVRRQRRRACGAARSAPMAGVSVPLQAAEHYYLITDTVPWAHPDLPVVEDPDRYGYYREEGGGILVGLFEPGAGAVVAGRHPARRRLRQPAARLGPHRAVPRRRRWTASRRCARPASGRCSAARRASRRTPCRSSGEAPELRDFFVAAGLNSLGILLSGGVGSVIAAVDRRRASRRST